VMVLSVVVEVLPKLVDPGGEDGDLDRRAAPVVFVKLVLLDDLLLFLFVQRHIALLPPRESTLQGKRYDS